MAPVAEAAQHDAAGAKHAGFCSLELWRFPKVARPVPGRELDTACVATKDAIDRENANNSEARLRASRETVHQAQAPANRGSPHLTAPSRGGNFTKLFLISPFVPVF